MLGSENFLANPHRPLEKAPRSSKALLALEDAAKVVQTRWRTRVVMAENLLSDCQRSFAKWLGFCKGALISQ